MLEELIKFAKDHHKGFEPFSDDQIKTFFKKYKETTKVRTNNAGEITGFAVWDEQPDKIVFLAVAGIGDRWENFRAMISHIRQFKKPVVIPKDIDQWQR